MATFAERIMAPLPTRRETMGQLNRAGYVADLNSQRLVIQAKPAAVGIDVIYQFEGPADSGDALILRALSSSKFGQKGTLLNACGAYSNRRQLVPNGNFAKQRSTNFIFTQH